MGKVYRDLSTEENRRFWQSVEKSAAEVRSWPAWKRGETQERKTSTFVLLAEKRSFLEGLASAAKEELESKTKELEIQKEKILSELKSEIKSYRRQIRNIEKVLDSAHDNSGKSESVIEAASRIVATWSPSKRSAFEQRTGLKLPENKSK